MSDRAQVKATIVNRLGLHARPATELVETANQFDATVVIRKNDNEVDGKSIMQVMLLAATQGTELEIECVGDDAEACAQALRELIEAGFSED